MATVVETQRLISVSLGKIARSRAQRGGINLHKNLLVASVLNKARTAFMMENYSYQLQQQQQQQKQQIPATAQPLSVTVTPSPAADSGNSLPTHVAETCPATPETETRSDPIDTQVSPELVNGAVSCHPSSNTSCTNGQMDSDLHCDNKENVYPSDDSTTTSENEQYSTPETKQQQCVSGEQHIEAANQLSHDAQLAGSTPVCQNNTSYITLSPCKQLSSATTTCTGVLKRRRVNPEAIQLSYDAECPASKRARVSSSDSHSQQHPCDPVPSSCEYASEAGESDMQTSDSPQITNLVSIFNSGFSGLCNVGSSSPSSSLEYDNSCYHSDSQSSVSHHQSWSNSDSQQSLHCSSMVERIGSISSAIVLSA